MNHYPYLGVDCDSGLRFKDHLTKVTSKARGAGIRAFGMGIGNGTLSVRGAVNVWKTLVRSVMEYGMEVWGEQKWEEGELLQREFGRRILRVNKFAPNEGVLGELGWVSLRSRRAVARLLQWLKILGWEESRLGKQIFRVSVENFLLRGTRNWVAGVVGTLEEYGLGRIWEEVIAQEGEVVGKVKRKEWERAIREKVRGRGRDGASACSRRVSLQSIE